MVQGVREGEGAFFYSDGRVYKGEWSQDKKYGYGVE
jgi:hypothetical protein